MSALSGDDRLPRYQRLADALREEVVQGRWRPGDQLPSENVIAEEYGVALGTSRQAFQQLVSEGLLERHRGRGTFVRRANFDQSLFRFFRFRGRSGERIVPESRILSREIKPAPDAVAQALARPANSEAIAMKRLRLLDGVPVLAEEIWLPADRFARFMELETETVGPLLYPIYDSECGVVIARAEEALTAESVSSETAALLGLEPGAPVIVIDRLARGYDDQPLEWRRSKGPADRFEYHVEIR